MEITHQRCPESEEHRDDLCVLCPLLRAESLLPNLRNESGDTPAPYHQGGWEESVPSGRAQDPAPGAHVDSTFSNPRTSVLAPMWQTGGWRLTPRLVSWGVMASFALPPGPPVGHISSLLCSEGDHVAGSCVTGCAPPRAWPSAPLVLVEPSLSSPRAGSRGPWLGGRSLGG